MVTQVVMPKLGLTMTEGVLARWLVTDGAGVRAGAPIFEVQTDKAIVESEAPATGVLRVLVGEGTTVPIGGVVGTIVAKGETIAAGGGPTRQVAERPAAEPTRIAASPAAKRRARELGLDLGHLRGSGEGGRITERDVEAFARVQEETARKPDARVSPAAQRLVEMARTDLADVPGGAPGGGVMKEDVERAAAAAAATARAAGAKIIPMRGVRAIIAERMQGSHQSTAHVTLTTEADAEELVNLRAQLKAALEPTLGFAVSYNDLLVKVVAAALRELPYMNATQVGESIRMLEHVNVGVAVDSARGLLVPVVRDADRKRIVEIAGELHALIERAVAGRSLPDDLQGGTFTITNLGMCEVDAFTPLINPPELAILGVGRIVRRPSVVEGQLALRQRLTLSLTFDHRLVDGAPAARFLQRVKQLCEQPYLTLVDVDRV